MKTITMRGIDEEIAKVLKEKAKKEGISVNRVLLKLITEGLGLKKKRRTAIHDDLDHLAGGWSVEDYMEFQGKVADFEIVDEDI